MSFEAPGVNLFHSDSQAAMQEEELTENPTSLLATTYSSFPSLFLLFLNMSETFAPLQLQEVQRKFP